MHLHPSLQLSGESHEHSRTWQEVEGSPSSSTPLLQLDLVSWIKSCFGERVPFSLQKKGQHQACKGRCCPLVSCLLCSVQRSRRGPWCLSGTARASAQPSWWAWRPSSLPLWVLLDFAEVPWALQDLRGPNCPHPSHCRQVDGECGSTDVTARHSVTCVGWWLCGICLDAILRLSLACACARGRGQREGKQVCAGSGQQKPGRVVPGG